MSRMRQVVCGVVASWAALAFTGVVLAQQDPVNRPERRDDRREQRRPVQVQERQQTEVRQEQVVPPADARPAQTFKAKAVIGSKAFIQGNVAIGTVDDIIFDDNGSVDYLVVLNEGKYVTVPWQAAKFDFERRTATVNITEKRFRAVPTYTLEQVPNYGSPVYRQQIYTYYGLRPGQERRIERREGFRRP